MELFILIGAAYLLWRFILGQKQEDSLLRQRKFTGLLTKSLSAQGQKMITLHAYLKEQYLDILKSDQNLPAELWSLFYRLHAWHERAIDDLEEGKDVPKMPESLLKKATSQI